MRSNLGHIVKKLGVKPREEPSQFTTGSSVGLL
jgi:hypothetical protein